MREYIQEVWNYTLALHAQGGQVQFYQVHSLMGSILGHPAKWVLSWTSH